MVRCSDNEGLKHDDNVDYTKQCRPGYVADEYRGYPHPKQSSFKKVQRISHRVIFIVVHTYRVTYCTINQSMVVLIYVGKKTNNQEHLEANILFALYLLLPFLSR